MPISQLEGVGAKLRDRLIDADISSVQRLAQASVETLMKIEGLGPKTSQALLERAKAMAQQLEEEYEKREAEKKAAAGDEADEKLTASDVFEDDEDFVTEVDDLPEVTGPTLEPMEEEESE